MPTSQYGIVLALSTGFLWAWAPIFWSSAGRRIGAMNVNRLRMLMSAVPATIAAVAVALLNGEPLRPGLGPLKWLLMSGILHMAVGDFFYYEAIVLLGPRRAIQALTVSPVAGVVVGWIWLNEALSAPVLAGVAMVLGGITYLAWTEGRIQNHDSREPGRMSAWGMLAAIVAGLCIGVAGVMTRYAYRLGPVDPLVAHSLRLIAGCAALWLFPLLTGGAVNVIRGLAQPKVPLLMTLGTLAGPLVGMFFFVAALKHAPAGLVATLSSTAPLFVLPIVAVRYRVRVSRSAILASLLTVGGIVLISSK